MNDKKINFVKSLASDIMISFTNSEIEDILLIEEHLLSSFDKVLAINTSNVEPLYHPFEGPQIFLHESELEHCPILQKEVLDNAPSVEGEYISISKVVK